MRRSTIQPRMMQPQTGIYRLRIRSGQRIVEPKHVLRIILLFQRCETRQFLRSVDLLQRLSFIVPAYGVSKVALNWITE